MEGGNIRAKKKGGGSGIDKRKRGEEEAEIGVANGAGVGKERRRRLCTILEFGRGFGWVGFGLSGGRGGGSESRLVFFSPFLPPHCPG